MAAEWIDVSLPIVDSMVHWPGDPSVKIHHVAQIGINGAPCNVSHLSMTAHTGTHMDGPIHFMKEGRGLEELPLDAVIGPCRVLELQSVGLVKVEDLKPHDLQRGERILLKTANSTKSWAMQPEFDKDFIYISKEAAKHIVDCGVRTIGVDYLSVGGFYKDGVETHHALLGAEVWIIEGLNLAKIKPGSYDLICLPIKLSNRADGAPARAVLRPR
jgi:arylformamidase